ncbi:MAG: aminotransferase class III-fold pyridoxal phosphate-dependent enzyme [Acidobacteriota bacterium]
MRSTNEGRQKGTAGERLYQRARQLIPGGTQLLSKRPELYLPEGWPAYYQSAQGVRVTDLDGRVFTDMSMMGIGACVLGYADPEVDEAAISALRRGVLCTLNAPEEVELAELLCEIHPWAGMVRFARSGGEAMSIAVRLARASTGRDKVAFCGYHGWTDWYLAANLGDHDALDGHLLPGLDPRGVPRSLKGTAFPFHYNRIEELEEIVAAHGSELAAIVMEPQREHPPENGFIQRVRQIAQRVGAVLVFDEITTGFRMTSGGIHLLLGIEPDVAVFAKAMANGYAMAAVIGRTDVMEAAKTTFISSTNWTERIGPAAALATIRKHRREKVAEHLKRIGRRVQQGWGRAAAAAGLEIEVGGLPSLSHFSFRHPNSHVLRTLFTRLMLDRGFLAYSQFKPCFAHTDADVDRYVEAVAEALLLLASGELQPAETAAERGFYRLT